MNNYESSKTVRRVASVIYLLVMAVIYGGTYFSNQQKEMAKMTSKESTRSIETPAVFSDTQARN